MSSPFILFFLIIEDKIEAVNQTGEMEHSTLVSSGLFDEGKSFWQEEQQGRIIAPLIFIFPLLAEGHRLLHLYCAIASSSAQLVGTCQQLFARREGYFLFTVYCCIFSSVQNQVQQKADSLQNWCTGKGCGELRRGGQDPAAQGEEITRVED